MGRSGCELYCQRCCCQFSWVNCSRIYKRLFRNLMHVKKFKKSSLSQAFSLPSFPPLYKAIEYHYCSRNILATYGLHMGSPYAAHMQPTCRVFSKTTKLYVAHMLSNIMVTYGEKQINIGAELQHMGNTYGQMWSFSHWKWAFPNIWAAYGEHMGTIPYTVNTHSNTSKPLPSPADAAPFNSVKLPPSLCWKYFLLTKVEQTKLWRWQNPDL